MGCKTEVHVKQRLMDTDCGLVTTRGKGGKEEVDRGKRGQIFGDGRKPNFER